MTKYTHPKILLSINSEEVRNKNTMEFYAFSLFSLDVSMPQKL